MPEGGQDGTVYKFKVKMISTKVKLKLPLDTKCETMVLTQEETSGNYLKSSDPLVRNKIIEDKLEEESTQCEFCGKQYKNYKRLKDHLRFCHPKVYHKCIICSQQFPKKWILNIHIRKHTGELPYSCSECGLKFISNSKLQMHLNFHHKQEELCCKICNSFGFYTKQDLNNHVRTKHTKERTFQCNICNKSFMSSAVYYQHRFIHTSVKKYSCKVCSKGFQRWMTLHNHLRIHKNEYPFECDVCKQAFRQRGDVKKHKKTQHSNLEG